MEIPDDMLEGETPFEYNKRKYPDTVARLERLAKRSGGFDPTECPPPSFALLAAVARNA